MKKISYFILIFFLSFLFLYILSFFYFYISINKELETDLFKDKQKINFYKKYSETVNHIRFADWRGKNTISQTTNLNEMIFTVINKSNNGKTILFQGDSWIQQITDIDENSNYLRNSLGEDFTIIGAGITSYSPSLMSLQFKLLEENFKIKTDFLITYIDQTDIGDEVCRYKNLKKFDEKGRLISVPYEKYPLFNDPFNLDKIVKLSEISLISTSKFYKVQKYMNYKIMKSFNKIVKVSNKKINKISISKKCNWAQIEKNLISPSIEDINYFKQSVREYFTRISNSKNLKKIYVVTHPHYKHIIGDYKSNVSDIINQISAEYSKINHINFTNVIKNEKNFYLDIESIWSEDNIHLKDQVFREKFIMNIIKYFTASLN